MKTHYLCCMLSLTGGLAALAGGEALADVRASSPTPVTALRSPAGAATVVADRYHTILQQADLRRRSLPGRVEETSGLTDYDVTTLDGKLSFDFTKKQVTTKASLTITANTSLSSIYIYILDKLSNLPVIKDSTGTLSMVDMGQGAYAVTLGQPLSAGQSATLTFSHQGTPTCTAYCEVSSAMTYNLSSSWMPLFIDYTSMVYPKVSTLAITLPASMAASASGTSYVITNNTDGTKTHTFTDKRFGRFSMGAAAYKTGTTMMGSTEVRTLIRPPNDTKGAAWRKAAVDILAFHQSRYGAYQYGKADIVEVSDTLAYYGVGGVAGLSAVFIPTMSLSKDPTDWTEVTTLAHEMAHQWFAYMVHNGEGTTSPWLNEGTATFSEMEYVSSLGTKKLGADYRPTYRRLVNQYYTYGMRGLSPVPISSKAIYSAPKTVYALLTYFKGALVVGMIRYALGGDATFTKAMKTYVTDHSVTSATVASLVASIKASTGKDLTALMQRWVYSTGYPTYSVAVSPPAAGGAVEIKVTSDKDFALPVEVDLVTADGKTTRKSIPMVGTAGTLKLQLAELVEVRFDPDHQIAGRHGAALAGDVHVNGEVDGVDLITQAHAVGGKFTSKQTSAGATQIFPEWADLVFDGSIDLADLKIVESAFGKSSGK